MAPPLHHCIALFFRWVVCIINQSINLSLSLFFWFPIMAQGTLTLWVVISALLCNAMNLQVVVLAQTQSNTYTTYNDYNPAAHGYSLDGLYCATYDSDQSLQWRSQYKWTAFCAQAGGPMGPSLCGKCLQVTNPSTQQSITVRILDQCSNGGLDLETDAFNAIDSNKAGYNAGHLYTTYTFVNC